MIARHGGTHLHFVAEAGGSGVQGQPGLYNESVAQKISKCQVRKIYLQYLYVTDQD
jgi:hypothetical protein